MKNPPAQNFMEHLLQSPHQDDVMVTNFLTTGGFGNVPQSLIELLKDIARDRQLPEKAKKSL